MIGPQTEAGYFNNNGRNVGPITSFTETYTIQSGSTTITGSGSLIDPPPGASIGGARLNTAECAELTGATLGSVTNASGTVVQAYLTAGITANGTFAPPGSYAYTTITRQFINSSSINSFNAGEFAQIFNTPAAPSGPPPGFITRSGTQLQLNGQAFRPVGEAGSGCTGTGHRFRLGVFAGRFPLLRERRCRRQRPYLRAR